MSRGGLKLEAALAAFGIDPGGRRLPGHRRLHRRLHRLPAPARRGEGVRHRRRPQPARLENPQRSARGRAREAECPPSDAGRIFPRRSSICVIDVSFISLTLILPPAFEVLTPTGVIIALIKPQFELGKDEVGKGGIVRDPAGHEAAVGKIRDFVTGTLGRKWEGVIESPILGGEGNKEFLACLRP